MISTAKSDNFSVLCQRECCVLTDAHFGHAARPERSTQFRADESIKRARIALKSGTLKGILWHQGESDSKDGPAQIHEAKLHELIARFRKTLDAESAPFIAGQMGQFAERPWSDAKKMVDAAHQNLPKHVKQTAFVNSNDLKHKGDRVHFDSASFREFGKRYFKAFQELTVKQGSNAKSAN